MRNNNKKILLLAVVLLTVTGCEKMMGLFGGGANPVTVANHFWTAAKTGEAEKIKPYVTESSFSSDIMKGNSQKQEGEVTLGTAKIENDKATIPTTLNNKGFNMELQTICVKENGKWKVDVAQTMMTMFSGTMGGMMKEMGEAVGEMGKALGEGIQKAGEELTSAAPASPPTPHSDQKFSVGNKLSVEWHGSWYPATVLEVGANKWKIHYDGYANSWDEWVDASRVK